MSRPLLVPGETCAAIVPNSRGGLLVDGRDFYRAFYDAACKARHSILMAGWQFSSRAIAEHAWWFVAVPLWLAASCLPAAPSSIA